MDSFCAIAALCLHTLAAPGLPALTVYSAGLVSGQQGSGIATVTTHGHAITPAGAVPFVSYGQGLTPALPAVQGHGWQR